MTHSHDAVRRPNPRAPLAAFLSFLFPGLGQAYNGQSVLGWLLAAPVLLVVVGALLAVSLARGDLLARFLDTRFLLGLIVLDLALLGWRLVAIAQAHGRREPAGGGRWTTYVTALLLVATLAMHALPAWYAVKAIDTLGAVAREGSGTARGPRTDGGSPVTQLPEPSDQPDVSRGERVNVLLVGIDAAPGRVTELTDTMLVVSLDPDSGRSAMVSVPRDLYAAPLPGGGTFDAKLNALMSYADARPGEFPLGGVGTLKASIGELLGVPIHYFAAINLLGFKDAIDAVGGVDVVVERTINDPSYFDEFENPVGLYLEPGTYHMDGHLALAYVRSRQGIGDSDFTRAARQQELLTAVRAKLTAGNLLLALPGLLDAVKSTIYTDVPSDQLPHIAQAVQDADMDRIERVVLQPPEYVTPEPFSAAGYILHPNREAIRELGQRLLRDSMAPEARP